MGICQKCKQDHKREKKNSSGIYLDLVNMCENNARLKSESERDLTAMREFQAKFIEADQENARLEESNGELKKIFAIYQDDLNKLRSETIIDKTTITILHGNLTEKNGEITELRATLKETLASLQACYVEIKAIKDERDLAINRFERRK